MRAISRPGKDQRLVYNGHKRVHALKFQSVSLPNGIIANLFGPVGRSEFLLHTLANVVTSLPFVNTNDFNILF